MFKQISERESQVFPGIISKTYTYDQDLESLLNSIQSADLTIYDISVDEEHDVGEPSLTGTYSFDTLLDNLEQIKKFADSISIICDDPDAFICIWIDNKKIMLSSADYSLNIDKLLCDKKKIR